MAINDLDINDLVINDLIVWFVYGASSVFAIWISRLAL